MAYGKKKKNSNKAYISVKLTLAYLLQPILAPKDSKHALKYGSQPAAAKKKIQGSMLTLFSQSHDLRAIGPFINP